MSAPAFEHTQQFLGRLNGVNDTPNGWEARCPCRNDDDNPSLAISEDERNGNILVTCHRGSPCSAKEICESVGLPISALFAPKNDKKEKNTLTKTYDYVDEHGTLLFQKCRYITSEGKKKFLQRRPTGKNGEWDYKLEDTPKVLYNLPLVLKAKADGVPIWVVEGEKDADTLVEMGYVATTPPNGAGKWLQIHTDALAGATVDIIADKDEPGIAHAHKVMSELLDVGCDVAAWVSPKFKDITDHIAGGLKLSDLEELGDMPQEEKQTGPPDAPLIEESPFTEAASKLEQLLSRSDLTAEQLIVKTSQIITSVRADKPVDFGRLVVWEDFIGEAEKDTYDWIIPGLLERSERVIIVAAEGVGKTMLARQVALCSAGGVHPFTYQRMKPVRTLTVDLENPERIIRRSSRNIVAEVKRLNYNSKVDAQILIKPNGLNLLELSDRMVLERALDEVQPELLVMGPLYKSFVDPGGRTSEAIAVEVAKYLDDLRTNYKCALWLEHHAPLGTTMSTRDLRPFGSAVWSRWPEFGLSLTPDPAAIGQYVYDVKHFRGARDERQWPTKMKRGSRLPFEVIEFMKVST
jgi:hypothetical protein